MPTLHIDPAELKPVVEAVVREVVGLMDWPAGRLALSEQEAAAVLGVARHVLRDARLAGDLCGRRLGRRIVYSRSDLVTYLDRQRNGRG